MATEFGGSSIVQTRMRAYVIVIPTPDLDQDAGLGATAEPLHAQALVAQFAVKTLVGTVLPRFARINQAVLAAHETGEYSYQQIAEHFGIHFTTAGRIVRAGRKNKRKTNNKGAR